MARKPFGRSFGEGFASTFAPTAEQTTMATLRELLSKPLPEDEALTRADKQQMMEARAQQIAASKQEQARAEALQPEKIESAESLQKYRQWQMQYRPFSALQKEDEKLSGDALRMAMRDATWPIKTPQEQTISINQAWDILKATKQYQRKPTSDKSGASQPKTSQYKIGDVSQSGKYRLTSTGWVPVK